MVERQSAVLGLAPTREHQVAVEADHSEICKFSNESNRYRVIAEKISVFLKKVPRTSLPADVVSVSRTTETANSSSVPTVYSNRVSSHSGFSSWLSQFADPEQLRPDNQEAPDRAPVPVISPGGVLGSNGMSGYCSDTVSSERSSAQTLLPHPEEEKKTTSESIKLPSSPDGFRLQVLISGLRKQGVLHGSSPVKLGVSLTTRVDDIILTLMEHGRADLFNRPSPTR